MLTINQCYLDFVDKILKQGKETYKDSNHHLLENLGNFYIIDDPFNLKFRAKYQHYTTDMLLDDIKSGKFDMEACPIKSDALYEYVKSAENPDDQGFVYTYPNRIYAHFDIDQFNTMKERILTATGNTLRNWRIMNNTDESGTMCSLLPIIPTGTERWTTWPAY